MAFEADRKAASLPTPKSADQPEPTGGALQAGREMQGWLFLTLHDAAMLTVLTTFMNPRQKLHSDSVATAISQYVDQEWLKYGKQAMEILAAIAASTKEPYKSLSLSDSGPAIFDGDSFGSSKKETRARVFVENYGARQKLFRKIADICVATSPLQEPHSQPAADNKPAKRAKAASTISTPASCVDWNPLFLTVEPTIKPASSVQITVEDVEDDDGHAAIILTRLQVLHLARLAAICLYNGAIAHGLASSTFAGNQKLTKDMDATTAVVYFRGLFPKFRDHIRAALDDAGDRLIKFAFKYVLGPLEGDSQALKRAGEFVDAWVEVKEHGDKLLTSLIVTMHAAPTLKLTESRGHRDT